MMTFTGKSRIRVRGVEAVLNDTTAYSNNGGLEGVFLFDNCRDVEVSGIEYVGPALATPATHLGYQGATFVRAITVTDGLKVDGRLTNLRYGVQSGDYADPTKGGCRNFDIRLRTFFCGYPLATYLAEGIKFDIDADHVHRGAYLSGARAVKGTLRYSNSYIAEAAFLVTDAILTGTDAAAQAAPVASPTTSFGADGIDVDVYDKGSVVFQPNSYMAAISLSRVDPGTYFRNIEIRLHGAQATDAISTQVHGFGITSVAKTYQTRYPFNWESTILLENIEVSGTLDKSATTITNGTAGALNIRTDDPAAPTHFATVRNLKLNGLTIKKGVSYAPSNVYVRGLVSPLTLDGFNADGLYVTVAGNATYPVVVNQSSIGTLDVSLVSGTKIVPGAGTVIGGYVGTPVLPTAFAATDVQVFTPGVSTWTKPANAVAVKVLVIQAGAGGGSGRRGAAGTVRCGGGGGGSGNATEMLFRASDLPATVNVNVTSGGAGGAAVTADDTNGNSGVAPSACFFGSTGATALVSTIAPSPGGGGTNATGAGGASYGIFQWSGQKGANASTTGLAGSTASAGVAPGTATTAGGSGGGITSGDVASVGGAGSSTGQRPAATVAAAGAIGGAGGTPTVPAPGLFGAGAGGGGSSITAAGGAGGAGVAGSGGGGGGASLNGNNSGAGGAGGDGLIIVTTYF
ncbi:hypothetical protein PY310_06110 [Pseudarthrobacter sp. H3Y2-7]|uniref:hypothetical protein n=1 Tax=Pseudarthrobacter naphthalenicus TaxID=3031328 RepID=UPI0023AF4F31|nr:hypothetical protein [Pseudarthrobacter sp. H3Y2-7]MDE8668158.1 hypothetical protein [Pseudarthrobacter sp. H3Y2-7]